MNPLRLLLLYAQDATNKTLSYQYGWPRYFRRYPRFHCTPINIQDRQVIARLRGNLLARWGRFDAIVMLHSVFSNTPALGGWLFEGICKARQPKIFFIGNEYKLMPEKMAFCEAMNLALLVTQSSSPAVHDLYRNRLGCPIYAVPYTGLDAELFYPTRDRKDRPIDIGYRSYDSPVYLGHNERRLLAEFFSDYASGQNLTIDISLDPKDRFEESAWADFLNRCKGQLGSEAGGDFFELTDETRLKINQYITDHPNAPMQDIYQRFFAHYANPVPLRVISGRNIEAAGTKTVQILFEGDYNGYLKPDEHYISLKKDFSNIDEVMRKFRDEAYCHAITENAYALVHRELTYEKLLDGFHAQLTAIM